jgi:hypothetical protein
VFVSTRRYASSPGDLFDLAAYWLIVAGVYLLVGVLFLYSGKSKLFDDDGHAPAALMVVSIMRGEFLPRRTKSVLLVALALALVTFACLSFGQTSTGNNQGTASLYTYFASTAVILLLVLQLPVLGSPESRR